MISDYAFVTQKFITKFLYTLNQCCRFTSIDQPAVTTAEYWERHITTRKQYDEIDPDTKEIWNACARMHVLRQPQIPDLIIAALAKNPKRSWLGLEDDIGNWCSANTIRRWLTSRDSFSYYVECIYPNLFPH